MCCVGSVLLFRIIYGIVSIKYHGFVCVFQMIAGFMLNILCVFVLVGFTETLGDHIFGFKELPPALMMKLNRTS